MMGGPRAVLCKYMSVLPNDMSRMRKMVGTGKFKENIRKMNFQSF